MVLPNRPPPSLIALTGAGLGRLLCNLGQDIALAKKALLVLGRKVGEVPLPIMECVNLEHRLKLDGTTRV